MGDTTVGDIIGMRELFAKENYGVLCPFFIALCFCYNFHRFMHRYFICHEERYLRGDFTQEG